MFYQEYSNKNKEIQNSLLLFLDREDNIEENYQNFIYLITSYKILDNRHELKSLLYLISNISSNRYLTPSFISKIEQLLKYLNENIKKNFTNLKIFDIFKNNKAILLILIEQQSLTIDHSVFKRISTQKFFERKYHHFFYPEIEPLIEKDKIVIEDNKTSSSEEENSNEDTSESNSSSDEDIYKKDDSQISDDDSDEKSFYENKSYMKFVNEFSKKLPNDFMKNRKVGQNENHICKLIREDLIDEFISYVNQHNYPLNSNIEKSIYES